MVITVACLGLRVCELLGLQWGDLDFENLTLKIQRSIVEGEVNEPKTEASESTLPLDPDLAEVLLAHKAGSHYKADSDYVFAGATGKPPWPDGILTDHLKPAAIRAGIGNIGWHTFRHTYSTLLHALGTTSGSPKRTPAPCRYSNHVEHLHSGCLGREAGSGIEGGQCPMESVSVVRIGTFREISLGAKSFRKMVGAPRFELGTSWSRTKRATRLRYAPTKAVVSGQWLVASGRLQAAACPRH